MLASDAPTPTHKDFALPVDGKIQVVPLGIYPVEHDGQFLVQVVDDRACQAILNNLQTEAQTDRFAGLCVDYEHHRHDPDRSSRAAGWVTSAERRADGIYTEPRWSASGRAALESGEFRFISPEFDPGSLEPLGGNRYRVTRLVGFGLTNSPNMRGMVPLTNRLTRAEQAPSVRLEQAAPARAAHVIVEDARGVLSHAATTDGKRRLVPDGSGADPLVNRLTGAGGAAGLATGEAGHAAAVATLARSLRATDRSLSIAQSYRRAESALDPATKAASGLVLSNRARKLRAKDKHLSLSQAYGMAGAK